MVVEEDLGIKVETSDQNTLAGACECFLLSLVLDKASTRLCPELDQFFLHF